MEMISSISHISVPVSDESQVGEARRAANSISEELQFAGEQAGKLAIIVTESATNLARHARHGEILLCPLLEEDGERRIDVIAIDRGPGIPDIAQSVCDGFSTAGTAGNGMGAISRLSDHFEIYSDRETGTVQLSRVRATKSSRPRNSHLARNALDFGFICVPKKGERLCGDTVAVKVAEEGGGLFMVADGLGHGLAANEASMVAARIFTEEKNTIPSKVLDSVHHGLRATRGAAVAVASIDAESNTVRYSGIGNIATTILHGEISRSLVSHNGIVGHQVYKIQEFTYPWQESSLLVMHSDGLHTNWRLSPYPGLQRKDPAVVAAVLYRDFSRRRDDVSVLVIKQNTHA